ncbi:MAG: SagB family peptide dehydrogenase [Gammaproteobacteria bacterium]
MGRKSREKKARKGPLEETAASAEIESPMTAAERQAADDPGPAAPGAPQFGGEPWYVTEGKRAEQLLDAGRVHEALAAFQSILSAFGDTPSYGKAVIQGRVGRCLHVDRRYAPAIAATRGAIGIAEALVPSQGVIALLGTLHSALGEALAACGRLEDAATAQERALAYAREAGDRHSQAVDLGHLAALALGRGQLDEARRLCLGALAVMQGLGNPAMEAALHHRLGAIAQARGDTEGAERHYLDAARLRMRHGMHGPAADSLAALAAHQQRVGETRKAESSCRAAVDAVRHSGDALRLADHLGSLAGIVSGEPARLAEARQVAEHALLIAQHVDAVAHVVWRTYEHLATIAEREAAHGEDPQARAELQSRATAFREVAVRAPRLLATLERLGPAPTLGRVAVDGRIARCLLLGRRTDLASARLHAALQAASQLPASGETDRLLQWLHADLGETLRADGRHADASRAYEQVRQIAADSGDLLGQANAHTALAELATIANEPEEAAGHWRSAAALARTMRRPDMQVALRRRLPEIDAAAASDNDSAETSDGLTIHERATRAYVFDTDLLIDGPCTHEVTHRGPGQRALAAELRPALPPSTRVYPESADLIGISPGLEEPALTRGDGCTILRRAQREILVAGRSQVLWDIVRLADGSRSVEEICAAATAADPGAMRQMLADLVDVGALDVSGRSLGRFLHTMTKKGVLPGGGLESEQVLQLATDGRYREYPGAARLEVAQSVPDPLQAFHGLTRARRSRRDYDGAPITRAELDAILHTACGVTGSMPWSGREVKLRAYPASGALYAVEIFPLALHVQDLPGGIYHYRAADSVLERIDRDLDPPRLVAAMLPVEREMVAGAAAMICLVGEFRRHEAKYGEGGYRMMVAEAGHISQNVVLAATSLGLAARPFGGVFDDLINAELGLDPAEEQFLLSVLIGHATSGVTAPRSA